MLTAYVDDFDMLAAKDASAQLWLDIGKVIDFKEEPHYWSDQPVTHLGCCYRTKQMTTKDGHILTTTVSEMKAYLSSLVEKFEMQYDWTLGL